MKAVRIHSFGAPEVLRIDELSMPEAGPKQVLIRVRAASVNPVDYKIREGLLPRLQLPVALGRDVSGTIEGRGAEAGAFREGQEVYSLLDERQGAYAEFVAVDAALCARKPRNLSHVEAAAVPLAGLTAWQGLFEHGGLEPGQRVLIHGAAGGVGHFAVQFAKARGATVIATAAAEHRAFLSSCGADQVIDYKRERFEELVKDAHLVLDLIGGATMERSFAVLARGGRLVSTVGQPDEPRAAAQSVRAVHMWSHPDGGQLTEITALIEADKVRPHVSRVFPLSEIREAHTVAQREHMQGKLVLTVSD